ncbi:MAG: hypothetical protein V2A67_01800 [Bacteroidota bacterium]
MEEDNPTNHQVKVSWAEDSDNERILKLSPRCAQAGMIRMYPDRSPVFNRLHRLVDPDSYHALALNNTQVVGLLGTVHGDMFFLDQPLRTAYFMDFRVDPDYRKGLTAYRLVKPTIERERSSGARLGLATVLRNNDAPMVFTKGRGGFPASLYMGDNRIFNFIPVRKLKTDPRFTIETPTGADITELIGLYNRYYQTYRLAPRLSEEVFRQYLSRIDGLGLENFRIARADGKIKAVVAIWDEASFRKYWVTRSNLNIKILNTISRLFSLFTEMPEPIRTNQPLKQLSLVLFAHDHSTEALGALLRYANNLHLGGKYSLLQIQIHEDDPAIASLKGLTGISIFSEIHLFTETHELAREIESTPGLVHLEFQHYI